MLVTDSSRLTWLEIDYDAIAGNTRALKRIVGADVTLTAVVKADAYGHGAVMTARTALANGAEWLGVSSVQEAMIIREAGIRTPILAMNATPPHLAGVAIANEITATIFDIETARQFDRIAAESGKKAYVHIKVDTGMGRLGVLADDVCNFVRDVGNLSHLRIEGIYTHFSMADEPSDYSTQQTARFKAILAALRDNGNHFRHMHACNSAGTLAHADAHFNMVRTGVALYGLHPSPHVRVTADFRPAMTWRTFVAQVKTLPAGHPVGYGNTYITKQAERIALLPVGYGDGYRRGPNNAGEVLIRGQRAPIIGRVSMEKTAVSVDHIAGVSAGDAVVLLGQQDGETITAEQIAASIGTINYEVTCNALPRLLRPS